MSCMRMMPCAYWCIPMVGRSQKFAVPKMPLGRCGPWQPWAIPPKEYTRTPLTLGCQAATPASTNTLWWAHPKKSLMARRFGNTTTIDHACIVLVSYCHPSAALQHSRWYNAPYCGRSTGVIHCIIASSEDGRGLALVVHSHLVRVGVVQGVPAHSTKCLEDSAIYGHTMWV